MRDRDSEASVKRIRWIFARAWVEPCLWRSPEIIRLLLSFALERLTNHGAGRAIVHKRLNPPFLPPCTTNACPGKHAGSPQPQESKARASSKSHTQRDEDSYKDGVENIYTKRTWMEDRVSSNIRIMNALSPEPLVTLAWPVPT